MRLLQVIGRRSVRFMSSKPETPLQIALNFSEEDEDVRYRTQKNPIIPNINDLPRRWNKMDAGKQDDVIAYLEDRMRGDWRKMTLPEKRAAWYVYFGPWGARSDDQTDPGWIYSNFAWFVGILFAGVVGIRVYRDLEASQSETSETSETSENNQ